MTVITDPFVLAYGMHNLTFRSGTIGLATMAAVQAAVSYAALVALFGPQHKAYLKESMRPSIKGLSTAELQQRAHMARDWRYFVFLAIFTLG